MRYLLPVLLARVRRTARAGPVPVARADGRALLALLLHRLARVPLWLCYAAGRSQAGQLALGALPLLQLPLAVQCSLSGRGCGLLVHDGLVHDAPRLGGKVQRARRLRKVAHAGGNVRDEHGVALSAKAVLQQPRQLAVSVRYADCAVVQCSDDLAQHEERCVDAAALSHAQAVVVGVAVVLAACQVDQMQLGLDHTRLLPHSDRERKDSV
mmetsp:Transcript_18575/g.71685  ORF Transcript_18575/g.71685 Transcript_18575/m.71685 type:complete len:211 (-) Transcript_18575:662-1294(-)